MMMDTATTELVALITEAETLFRQQENWFCAKKLQEDARLIQEGNFLGLAQLLLHFGGMGNMDDYSYGNELDQLLSDIFERTRALILTREEEVASLSAKERGGVRARLSPNFHAISYYLKKNRPPSADHP